MPKRTDLVGAFLPYTCKISNDDLIVFKEALDGLLGVTYLPVAVSKQLVSGTNYKFFCNAEAIISYPLNGAAIVNIYKPLKGKAHITSIQNIH